MHNMNITLTHQNQSFQIPRGLQHQIASVKRISLVNGNLPKATPVDASLNGGAIIQCKANGHSSITARNSPSFKQWFKNRAIGTPITVSVNQSGTLLIFDATTPPALPAVVSPTSSSLNSLKVNPPPLAFPTTPLAPPHSSIGSSGILIPAPYPNPISLLYPYGMLVIPDLPWAVGVPPLRLAKIDSLKGMFTTVKNHGYGATINRYIPGVLVSQNIVPNDINRLEAGIISDINTVIGSGHPYQNNPLLGHIAVGIHLWGGRAGRNAFNFGGGFAANCPLPTYANLINLLMTHPKGVSIPNGNWRQITAMNSAFHNIGVSFLTKHLSFWSRATASPIRLPILDRVVFNKFIDPRRTPMWTDYVLYVTSLEACRVTLAARPGLTTITIPDMERQLFNWLNSTAAIGWVR